MPTVPICTMVPPGRTRSKAARRAGGRTRCLKDHVEAKAGQLPHLVVQIVRSGIKGHIHAQFDRLLATGSNNIADRDRNRAKGARGHGYQQADGSSAGHEHALARYRAGTSSPRAGRRREAPSWRRSPSSMSVRQQMTLIGADGDEFRKSAIGGRRGAGAAQHNGLAAEVDLTAFAVGAKAAGAGGVHRDPLADFHRIDIVAQPRLLPQ